MPTSVARISASAPSRSEFPIRSAIRLETRAPGVSGRLAQVQSHRVFEPVGVALVQRAVAAQPVPLGLQLLRRHLELGEVIARREAGEQVGGGRDREHQEDRGGRPPQHEQAEARRHGVNIGAAGKGFSGSVR